MFWQKLRENKKYLGNRIIGGRIKAGISTQNKICVQDRREKAVKVLPNDDNNSKQNVT